MALLSKQKITPFLWFDDNAEEAVNFYASLFPNSSIGSMSRYPEGSPYPAGTVMTANFNLSGQEFIALNAGPHFKFTEAISFMVECEDQAEVDKYWDALTKDGGEESMCGWLKDKYGLSWQITPRQLMELMSDKDKVKASRVMQSMMTMKKIDIATIQAAYDNE